MQTETKPLEISNVLGKVKNRIARIGVELEGAWSALPPGVPHLQHDGSVFADRNPGAGFPYVGELPVGPVEPNMIGRLITVNYPHKVNATCGMHVHMSFETLGHYNLLMVPEYQDTIIHYLREWATANKFKPEHHIWTRLRGESQYCQKGFWPDMQASAKRKDHHMQRPGHRYTIIHYCGRQNTIECRVLPMMKQTSVAISAVQHVVDITNACLYVLGKNRENRKPIKGKVELPNGFSYEEQVIEQL